MKNNIFLVITVVALFIFCSCTEKKGQNENTGKPDKETGNIKVETIDGIPHVYNGRTPLKGEVTLELEKLFEIDSLEIDKTQPPSFSQFTHSGDRIYLLDRIPVEIYIFDTSGNLQKKFKIKGQGPGEITRVTQFALWPLKNDLLILSDGKAIRFDNDGKVLDEIKFEKRYRGMGMLNENNFIGRYLILNPNEKDKSKRQKLFFVRFDREENVLTSYFEGEGLGGLPIEGENVNGQLVSVLFVNQSLVPDLVYSLDNTRQLIYISKNSDYAVSIKDIEGKLLRVIHREFTNKLVSEEDRKEIVDRQLFRQRDDVKKLIARNLPSSFCAISNIIPLPRGYFAVHVITGPRDYDIDIFDPEGRYIYRLKFPGDDNNFRTRYYLETGRIGSVESVDDRDIYREYRIKNLAEIFGNLNN